jgi:hypothetical protein
MPSPFTVVSTTHGMGRTDDPWKIYGPTADVTRDLADWLGGIDRRQHPRRQRELDHFASRR